MILQCRNYQNKQMLLLTPRWLQCIFMHAKHASKIHTIKWWNPSWMCIFVSIQTGKDLFTCGPVLHYNVKKPLKLLPRFHHCAQTQCWCRCQATVALCYNMRPGPSHACMRQVSNITRSCYPASIINRMIYSATWRIPHLMKIRAGDLKFSHSKHCVLFYTWFVVREEQLLVTGCTVIRPWGRLQASPTVHRLPPCWFSLCTENVLERVLLTKRDIQPSTNMPELLTFPIFRYL